MLQQGTNLAVIIKPGAVLMIIAMTIFYLPSVNGAPNQTTLAAIDIVRLPKKNVVVRKKTRQVKIDTLFKKLSASRKKTTKYKPGRIKISGYRGETFVYGEVIPLEDGKLQGFIYHPDDSKIYVYGEKVKNKINLYDASGNLYQMLHKDSTGQ